MPTPTDSELLDRFHRRLAGIEPDVKDAPPMRRHPAMGYRALMVPALVAIIVLVGAIGLPLLAGQTPTATAPAGTDGTSDWRIAACFADQPGVAIIETFEVKHVSDLFPRMNPWDRDRIGAGTDERPGFVVRLRGKLKIVQPAVGPLPAHTFEIDDPTCLIVFAPDGTFPEGEVPLWLGPLRGG